MSSDNLAIHLRGVEKTFSIYDRPHHRLLESLLGTRRRTWHREFHALQGIDLDVRHGETVGLIGRNGAGKSTLLQIICGILTPTRGVVDVRGRIAALLELGAGFNAEFSGRENVFLNGTVLGLTRAQIEARFDTIAAFADIGDFIDQPVKTYSSGMYIRLAFAVAIHVDPDILVIDEALSVGDEAFQRKCFARIEHIRASGATVLFVSHGVSTVAQLCDRAVLIDAGEALMTGPPKPVISRYHKLLYASAADAPAIRAAIREEFERGIGDALLPIGERAANDVEDDFADGYLDPGLVPQTVQYGGRGVQVDAVRIETADGRRVNVLRAGVRYVYRYRVRFDEAAALVRFGMMIRTVTGLELGGCSTAVHTRGLDLVDAGTEIDVAFGFRCLLAAGTYFLNAGVLGRPDNEEVFLERLVDAAMFRVLPDLERLATGLVDLDFEPNVDLAVKIDQRDTLSTPRR
ncbi:MAG: ABC transporter ATP-binding protein [Dokdonella sp.]